MADHGTLSSYVNDRCRCPQCRQAHRLYLVDYHRRRPRTDFLGPPLPRTDGWTTTDPTRVGIDPRWGDEAVCRGMDPDLFFPERGDLSASRRAKEVCATCPVQEECLRHALDNHEDHGVWGGTSPRDRRRLRGVAA